uniref:RBR-type E3 ubiquitin transferase n=1 Tax=Aegilops tauschii subsp. strangulata TaxID=200361 RepID=A0A453HCI5_AEGTS
GQRRRVLPLLRRGHDEEEDGLEADEDDVGLFEDAAPQPEHRADHWAITRKSLSAAQQQDVSMVMNLVNLERHNARALLMHHRWKMDRIHDFLERRGREGLFREAGIVVPPEDSSTAARARVPPHKRPRTVTCNVCFEDVSRPSDVSTMDCGHCFCNDCWTEHFFASLGNGKKHIHCMQVKCPAICDDGTVRRLLGRKYPDAAKRFDNLVLDSYLDNNASVKWCPSAPHCGRAIRVVDASERYCEVECPCGVSFCFNCAAPAHSPCPCPMWDKWDAKFRGESENLKWIAVNTKSCPKCLRPIEKNGGCNHVSCPCGQHLWIRCTTATATTRPGTPTTTASGGRCCATRTTATGSTCTSTRARWSRRSCGRPSRREPCCWSRPPPSGRSSGRPAGWPARTGPCWRRAWCWPAPTPSPTTCSATRCAPTRRRRPTWPRRRSSGPCRRPPTSPRSSTRTAGRCTSASRTSCCRCSSSP